MDIYSCGPGRSSSYFAMAPRKWSAGMKIDYFFPKKKSTIKMDQSKRTIILLYFNWLPRELREMLQKFIPKEMLLVLSHLSDFRIRAEDLIYSEGRICNWAAQNGYLSLLQWLRSQNPPVPW